MALFCATIRRDSVSLFRFPFLKHVQVFSCEVSSVYRWKYQYSCFSSYFCFLVIVLPFALMLSALLLSIRYIKVDFVKLVKEVSYVN